MSISDLVASLKAAIGLGSSRKREALRTKVEALQGISLFKDLDGRSLERLAEEAFFIDYEPGSVLVEEGHKHGLSMFVIVSGCVRWETRAGKSGDLKAGKVVGEMSVIDNQPRSATVKAVEQTRCIQLTRDKVLKLMNKHGAIATGLAIALAAKLRETNQSVAAPAAPAPAPSPAVPAASQNGHPPSSQPADAAKDGAAGEPKGYKQQAQDALLAAFSTLYTMKAMTRFSVAILGCPVEGLSEQAQGIIRMGDVKAVLLPAGRAGMRVAADAAGDFTLHVFTPETGQPVRFGPVGLDPGQDCRLEIAGGAVSLTRDGERISRID